MWRLPGTGTEEHSSEVARQIRVKDSFPIVECSSHPPHLWTAEPYCFSWPCCGVLANAGDFTEVLTGRHTSPCSAATDIPCVPRGVPALRVPGVPCVYIDRWSIQQTECSSSFSPCGRHPVELGHAVFVPLFEEPLHHLAWHHMSSEVCTEVSAAVALGDETSGPLICGPCAMAVCVRGSPILGL